MKHKSVNDEAVELALEKCVPNDHVAVRVGHGRKDKGTRSYNVI